MNILSRVLYRYSVKPYLAAYCAIRRDFLEIYRHVYTLPVARDRYGWDALSDSELRKHAVQQWTTAQSFDPHATIRQPVQRIRQFRRFIAFLFFSLFLLAAGLGWGIQHWALSGVSMLGTLAKWGISSLPADIVAMVSVYWYLLSADTGVVQQMNEDLAIPPSRIHAAARNTDTQFAYYLWNQSLNSREKWPVVLFLLLVKTISGRLYDAVMRMLQSNMDVFFVSDGLPDLFRRLWKRHTQSRSATIQ